MWPGPRPSTPLPVAPTLPQQQQALLVQQAQAQALLAQQAQAHALQAAQAQAAQGQMAYFPWAPGVQNPAVSPAGWISSRSPPPSAPSP